MLVTSTGYSNKLIAGLVGAGVSFDLKVCLYVNNFTPLPGSLLSAFTEPSDAGYTRQAVLHTAWTFAIEAGEWVARAPAVHFALTGPDTLYGYFVSDPGFSEWLWAERSALAPFAFPSGAPPVALALSLLLADFAS